MVEENGVKKEIARHLFGKVKKNCKKITHTKNIYTIEHDQKQFTFQ